MCLIRAVKAFKSLIVHVVPNSQSILTLEELSEAERLLITQAQVLLVKDKSFESWKKQLGLFQACGGMVLVVVWWQVDKRRHSLFHETPSATPQESALIVKEAHEHIQHNGVKETLTELQARYWVVKGRSLYCAPLCAVQEI